MALTKVSRGLLNTSIVDNGNATAITIDSSENVSFTGAGTFSGNITVNGGNAVIGAGGGGNGLGALISKGAVANFYEAYDGTKTMIVGTDAANDFVKIGSLSAHPVGFVVGNSEKVRIDASGNVGIGVVPSAWLSAYKSIELGIGAAVIGRTDDSSLSLLTNLYRNSAGDYIYKNTGDLATMMTTESGGFSWNSAAVGTAGGTASLSNLMTLNAAGQITHSTSTGSCFSNYVEAGVTRGYVGSSNSLVSGGLSSMCLRGDGGIILSVGGSQAMVIDTSGNLLVGAGSITAERNTSASYAGYFNNISPTGNGLYVQAGGTTERILDVRNYLGSTRFYITGNGHPFLPGIRASAGSYTAKITAGSAELTFDTSSARYKDNIRDSDYGLSAVMQLQSRMFEYKEDDQRTDVGFIAEEVNEVIPELVVIDAEGRPDAVNYDRMTSVLLKGMQEQQAIIEALTARLEALEGA